MAKNATTASVGKTYQVDFYNLDVIVSVGYRVKSIRGTQFRIWANKILKDYIIQGYSLNQNLLAQQNKELTRDESTGFLKIIADYAYALDILDQYDYQELAIQETSVKETFQLTYDEAIRQILMAKKGP